MWRVTITFLQIRIHILWLGSWREFWFVGIHAQTWHTEVEWTGWEVFAKYETSRWQREKKAKHARLSTQGHSCCVIVTPSIMLQYLSRAASAVWFCRFTGNSRCQKHKMKIEWGRAAWMKDKSRCEKNWNKSWKAGAGKDERMQPYVNKKRQIEQKHVSQGGPQK